MRYTKLSDADIADLLRKLPGWSVQNGKLHVKWKFRDFPSAIGFMTAIAIEAQAMDHHPEWFNVWAFVTVDLVTHDVKAISGHDAKLAVKMEALAKQMGAEAAK